MKHIPIGIAAEIRSELARQCMSMKVLGEQTGLSYDSVRRKIKEESREITMADLQKIAEALDIRVSTLVARAEEADLKVSSPKEAGADTRARGHNPLGGKGVA